MAARIMLSACLSLATVGVEQFVGEGSVDSAHGPSGVTQAAPPRHPSTLERTELVSYRHAVKLAQQKDAERVAVAKAEDARRAAVAKHKQAKPPLPSRPPTSGVPSAGGDILARIAACESGGSYVAENPHSTASGKYQVLDSTWGGYGGFHHAASAPPAMQERQAHEMYARSGTRPWWPSRHCWAA